MQTPIERVRLSKTAEEQLNKLKRTTKIEQWNILCRWALCRSLAEPSMPSPTIIPTNSKVVIAWDTFGGEIADILLIALKQRCQRDRLGTEEEIIRQQFTLHLHRGIGYLAGNTDLKEIEDLVKLAI